MADIWTVSDRDRTVIESTRSGQGGFSLMEVMIVLVIVAILAAIGLPAYQDTVARTWRSKSSACLTEMAQAMERRFTGQLSYLGPAADPDQLPPNTCTVDDGMADRYAFSFTADPTATVFQLQAVPQGAQLAQDVQCGTLTIDQRGDRTVSGTDVAERCF